MMEVDDEYQDAGNTTNPRIISDISLQEEILNCIAKCPDRTIRPARLAAELGSLSVEDATAELCCVMAAVGSGATFYFEKTNNNNQNKQHPVMVFTFPPDFRRLALRAKQREDWKECFATLVKFGIKALQLFTALGLILSLLILAVLAVVIAVAGLIALSRAQGTGSNDRQSGQRLMYQMRQLCFTFREIIWCYAVFGPDLQDNNNSNTRDPWLREMAYDMALISSVCCGHPGSIFYWWRVQQLSRRRHVLTRGWRRNDGYDYEYQDSGQVEGVRLVRNTKHSGGHRNDSDDEQEGESGNATTATGIVSPHRGVLSVSVEFLFGPILDWKRMEQQKWKLRAAFLVQQSSDVGSVSLAELAPYVDYPPPSLQHVRQVMAQGLLTITHFHGVPHCEDGGTSNAATPSQARFVFPELISESAIALQYNDTVPQQESLNWTSFFWDTAMSSSSTNRTSSSSKQDELPIYYHEPQRHFTDLSATQFVTCVVLGMLNWLGAFWLQKAVTPGIGVLDQVVEFQTLAQGLRHSLVPVLVFYSYLFWIIALLRATYLAAWCNRRTSQRNQLRQQLAQTLQQQLPTTMTMMKS